MQRKKAGPFSFLTGEDVFTEESAERDVLLIQALYYDRGFVQAKVTQSSSLASNGRDVTLVIGIEEGDVYRLGTLGLAGYQALPEGALRDCIHSRTGDVFNRSKLSGEIACMTALYQDAGFAQVEVRPDTVIDEAAKTIAVRFQIVEGPLTTVEQVDVRVTPGLSEAEVRGAVRVKPGDRFSQAALTETKRRVLALEGVDSADLSYRRGSVVSRVIVTIEARHGSAATLDWRPLLHRVSIGLVELAALLAAALGLVLGMLRIRRRVR
jgi:outer membrane protein insertion porin family